MVIAVDEDPAVFGVAARSTRCACGVVGRCESLPLASASIDLVVCNHALEHFSELDRSLEEINRVLKPRGKLFLSVPDGHGFCDHLYRWLFEGGGHVNRFRRSELAELIESRSGLALVKWQRLYSSFGYFRGIPDLASEDHTDLQARLRWVGRLPRRFVDLMHIALYAGTRIVDRCVGTSTSVYGWAMWFDRSGDVPVEMPGYINVCRFCGAGHPPDQSRRPFHNWICDSCRGQNRFWFK